jgi:peptide/nickel transport system substrate-binding protein
MLPKLRKTLVGVAAASALLSALAGCAGNSGSAAAKDTSTLVIEDNPVSPFTQNFNPFDTNDTAYEVNAVGMIYEPLLQFNSMKPGQVYPWLAQSYDFSNSGKTITFHLRPNLKWSDGQPLTSKDVAFTFNLLKQNKAINLYGINPTSVSAPDASTVVLTFDQPQYVNLYYIGSAYMVPQHVWSSVSNPSTFSDPKPIGSGPYTLKQFSSQGFTLTKSPNYWQPVKIQNLSFPSYVSNTTASLALSQGQIDWGGNDIPNIDKTFTSKDPQHNKYWFAPVNVVTLELNVTKGPLANAAVRRAISAGIDRSQLSKIGETGYEPVATSSGGLLLPTDNSFLTSSLANNLTQNKSAVSSDLTSAGYHMSGGHWLDQAGNPIKFTIEDPSSYSDYFEDASLIVQQLNAQGFEVDVKGTTPDAWTSDYNTGAFDATLHWGSQGPSPYYQYDNWLDNALSAPIGQPATGDAGRYNNPQAQAALAEFANTNDQATQKDAMTKLQQIVATDAPVIPLLYGAAWDEYSTTKFTGWPTQDNPYIDPTPNSPFMEYTVLHLSPVS